MSNPQINIGEDLVFTAVLTNGNGGPALTGKTLRAEVRDVAGNVVSTGGPHTSTESPAGTYKTIIPAANLAALNDGQTYVPRYYGTNFSYDRRGKKVAGYGQLT